MASEQRDGPDTHAPEARAANAFTDPRTRSRTESDVGRGVGDTTMRGGAATSLSAAPSSAAVANRSSGCFARSL